MVDYDARDDAMADIPVDGDQWQGQRLQGQMGEGGHSWQSNDKARVRLLVHSLL